MDALASPVIVTKIMSLYGQDARKSCSFQRHASRTASVGRCQFSTAKTRGVVLKPDLEHFCIEYLICKYISGTGWSIL